MRRLKVFLILLTVVHCALPPPIFAAREKSFRGRKQWGFNLGFNGGPAPSSMGLQLAFNPARFVQFTGGFGAYTAGVAEVTSAVTTSFRTAGYGVEFILQILLWLITFNSEKLSQVNFQLPYKDLPIPATIFTVGGGVKFLVPVWDFSPFVGTHWSNYHTIGAPFGLAENGSHFYYTLGVDWQVGTHLNFTGSFQICPQIGSAACGALLTVGLFF